jgi:hypothetical protein
MYLIVYSSCNSTFIRRGHHQEPLLWSTKNQPNSASEKTSRRRAAGQPHCRTGAHPALENPPERRPPVEKEDDADQICVNQKRIHTPDRVEVVGHGHGPTILVRSGGAWRLGTHASAGHNPCPRHRRWPRTMTVSIAPTLSKHFAEGRWHVHGKHSLQAREEAQIHALKNSN